MIGETPGQMWAAVYRGSPTLSLERIPVPPIGPDELLVRTAVCGVCPTDIKKIQHRILPPPRVFGHEISGTIVKTGSRVRGFKPGERVVLHHHVPCQSCHACNHRAFAQCEQYRRTGVTAGFEPAGGGFAEYVRVMSHVFPGIVRIPKRNTFLEAAMLEPVNTVLKAVNRLNLKPGDAVWVVGQGPIGLIFTRILSLMRMKVAVTDLLPERVRIARRLGARLGVDSDEPLFRRKASRFTHGRGFDAAVVTAQNDRCVSDALDMIRGGGKIMIFAHTRRGATMPIDLSAVCVEEKDIIGSYSSDITLQQQVAQMVFSRRLDVRKLITGVYPLTKINEAIRLASNPGKDSIKVVIDTTANSYIHHLESGR